jgi:TonB-linked SusC/RagA family outer membrane protein
MLFLVFVLTIQVSASVYSQNTRLNVDARKVSIKDVLKDIESKSGFRFFYNDGFDDLNKLVDVKVSDGTITEILDQLIDKSRISYQVLDDNLIVFTPKESKQLVKVTGVVTDASNGDVLPGVYVRIEGTNAGGITDVEGKYSIELPDPNLSLKFSYVGYTTQDVGVNGRTVVDVALEPEIQALDEIVVTGYSTEKKKDIIGSVAVVNTDDMLKTNSVNISGQLQGRAAGVFVSSTGDPGADSKVRIRGFGSFDGSEPLYVIDGVPADGIAFNNLNPNDVQSIQVLKDAAAASVYGARAASGVVIISTKTGKPGKAKVSVDMYSGVNYVNSNNFPELLNAQEYGDYWWKSYENAGLVADHAQYGSGAEPVIPEYVKAGSYSGSQLEGLKTSDPALFSQLVDPSKYNFKTNQIVKSADTDWFDEIFNPASITNIQIGATGGSESGTYALSMSYFDQDNTSNKWANFTRYTARANSSFNLANNLRIGENLQVAYTDTKGNGTGSNGCYMNPLMPVWDIEGNPASGSVSGMGNVQNPISTRWRNRFDKSNSFNVFGNVYAELTLVKDLVLHTSFGINYNNMNSWDLTQQTYEHAENTAISSLSRAINYYNSWTWTNTATYAKTFGKHAVKLLVGSEAIRNYGDNVTAARSNYNVNDDYNFLTLDTGTGPQSNSGAFTRTSLASIFGRIDYTFNDKYLINATIRRDGSSKFGENNRYGIFPAVGLGWRISKEHFMENLVWLDDLKIRASYGVIGNQNGLSAQNQYTIYTLTTPNGYALNGGNSLSSGFGTYSIGNPDAKWEKNITKNIGFDATMFRGKYNISFEYYIKETKDLLVQNQAAYTGSWATQPSVNIGDMTNTGVDLNLSTKGKIIGELSYDIGANFSLYRNKVDRVLESDNSFLSGASDSDMGVITRTEKGNPMAYIWGYQVDGFFETQEEVDSYSAEYTTPIPAAIGRWRLKDTNEDKKVNDLDKIQLGSPHPDFQVGLNVSLAYRNFDFTTFVYWNQGGEVFNLFRRDIDMNRWQYNRSNRMLYQSYDPTSQDNSDALLPKLDITDTQTKMVACDYYVEDVTYVRMKTLQIGYNLPNSMVSKARLEGLRIYVQAQNLFTILGGDKPFTGLDPDASMQGIHNTSDLTTTTGTDISMGTVSTQNPTPRQFVIGINLKF